MRAAELPSPNRGCLALQILAAVELRAAPPPRHLRLRDRVQRALVFASGVLRESLCERGDILPENILRFIITTCFRLYVSSHPGPSEGDTGTGRCMPPESSPGPQPTRVPGQCSSATGWLQASPAYERAALTSTCSARRLRLNSCPRAQYTSESLPPCTQPKASSRLGPPGPPEALTLALAPALTLVALARALALALALALWSGP